MISKIVLASFLIWHTVTFSTEKVKILQAEGDVRIRRGVEESWNRTTSGVLLDEIDSILTGEGSAVLRTFDGTKFSLGSNTILDIADLRKLSEQEMFLMLMSKKIDKIAPGARKVKLRIGNVHVPHGSLKTDQPAGTQKAEWKLERNGAVALFEHNFLTNAAVKLNKILQKYQDVQDCGELNFRLGQTFEALDKTGQAIAAYQAASAKSEDSCEQDWGRLSEAALKNLK